ncbi:hypothetical protein HCJ39_07195 [Listeria rocourtiae]|uniref:hypothetical protein n=1 Tax=Listeria rocourtiae TaxID=647910 RepID=UPI0016296EE9|nr:hypothetical protein [Listeria rocourtiae]MBC1604496.1 hypothetical protein [Listeria rocourtiae]
MFIFIDRAIIDGKEIPQEKLNVWDVAWMLSERMDSIKLNPDDCVIHREPEEFQKEYHIHTKDDVFDYLFENYRYYHLTEQKKAIFKIPNATVYLSFS